LEAPNTYFQTYFLTLFTAEILLKLYTFGFRAFFKKLWNVFDTLVVGSALIITALHAADGSLERTGAALDFVMVLRVMRIFKVFHAIPRFKVVLNTLLRILPSMATYGSILVIVYYFFAVCGMAIFAGKIRDEDDSSDSNCGNPRLRGTAFAEAGYCENNFNSLPSSFVLLFELMVVNQWHVLAEGHSAVAGTKWALIFFAAFHVVAVIVILSIFTAFVLEAFVLEYSVSQSPSWGSSSKLTSRIRRMGLAMPTSKEAGAAAATVIDAKHVALQEDADHDEYNEEDGRDQLDYGVDGRYQEISMKTPLRFHLSYRAKSVQHLLERMFEADLRREGERGQGQREAVRF